MHIGESKCLNCGRPIDQDLLDAQCPSCLLQQALMTAPLSDELSESPQTIGKYVLLEKLGQGGMGIVYRARHLDVGRIVALKTIRAGRFSTDAGISRFMQEALAVSSLDHPAIVPVHEIGMDDGVYFLTMPYVEGSTLEKLLKDRPLSEMRACKIVCLIAKGVQYAHQRGIIHRDLKPANIIVELGDHPRIIDFGLAKKLDELDSLTATGEIVGTPSYMSPEQASRDATAAERSDVYSLGAILYACLVGRPPFQTDNPMLTIKQVIAQAPISPRVFNRSISKDVATICLKCLEKEPRQRYSSARELAEDLERFLACKPIKARAVGHLGRVLRWSKRHPAVSALSIGILSLTLASLGVVLRLNRLHHDSLVHVNLTNRIEQIATASYSELPRLIPSLSEFPESLLKTQFEDRRAQATHPDNQLRLTWAAALVLKQPKLLDLKQILNLPLQDAICLRRSLDTLEPGEPLSAFVDEWRRDDPQLSTSQRIRWIGLVPTADLAHLTSELWRELARQIIEEIHANPAEFAAACEWFTPCPDGLYQALEKMLTQAHLEPSRLRIAIALMAELQSASAASIAELAMHCDADLAPLISRYVFPLADSIRRVFVEELHRPLPDIELDALASSEPQEVVALAERRLQLRQSAARRRALAAAWLCRLGAQAEVWPLLGYQPDPTIRAETLHDVSEAALDWRILSQELLSRTEPTSRAGEDRGILCGLLFLIGDAAATINQSDSLFEPLEKALVSLCGEHPDAGVHAATRWTLSQLGKTQVVNQLESLAQYQTLDTARDWYVTQALQPMVVLRGPIAFSMGTDWQDPNRLAGRNVDPVTGEVQFTDEEPLIQRRIDRDFTIGMTEVSLGQWLAFDPQHHTFINQAMSPTLEHPANRISWFAAAAYCNWLSEREGIDPSQWCFIPNAKGKYALGMKLADDYLHRTGYRMPTEAEWEYACRAGTQTRRYFGDCDNLLPEYVWYKDNSQELALRTVGSLKPNAYGLFDSLGNSLEWCVDPYTGRPHDQNQIIDDWERDTAVDNEAWRVLRGTHLYCETRQIRATDLWTFRPISAEGHYGLRLARTLKAD